MLPYSNKRLLYSLFKVRDDGLTILFQNITELMTEQIHQINTVIPAAVVFAKAFFIVGKMSTLKGFSEDSRRERF